MATKRKPALLLAEFDTTRAILHAAEKLRDLGYKKYDTHTPFPIHGMDAAMGLKDSLVGPIVFVAGLTGVSCAFAMMYWMNGVDYPLVVGGKPPGAIPSMVPVMFELTVLFASITAVFAMFGLNKIPQHHHPIFNSTRFEAATDDKFFVSVAADDPKFDVEKTRKTLESLHCTYIELIHDDDSPAESLSIEHAEA